MTISQLLAWPGLLMRERRMILRALLDFSETDLFLRAERPIPQEIVDRYIDLMVRRKSGEPLAYILGKETFYKREFQVTPAVLIPRPETELLIVEAIKRQPETVLDLCTGSGILGITLQKELNCQVTASDISPEALAIAQANAERLEAEVTFCLGDLFDSVTGQFDLIVSNPPYIDRKVLPELEVASHEPTLALDGGDKGLDVYRRLIPQASAFLKPGGSLLLEIGYDQAQAITQLLTDNNFHSIGIQKDLSGFDRLVSAVYGRKHD